MSEAQRLVAREAVLNEALTAPRSREQTQDRGQDEVLEDLVRQHSRLVYRIAYAALRSHHDAEDATQETFLRVLRYSHKLGTVQNHKTWLARIAWRVAVDRSRHRGRRREIALEDDREKPVAELASDDLTADEAIQGVRVGSLLEGMITALPEKLRQPLFLSTIEEMSPREVAATLKISEAAVRSRVFRARQILREKLTARMEKK
jgi:RNA polymerase sigma factor (sigma-70 family)